MRFATYSLLAIALIAPSNVFAQTTCSEPSAPYCLTGINTFEDQLSFDLCRRDMSQYAQEVVDHLECLKAWADDQVSIAKEQNASAQDALENAVKYWNCKSADPAAFCLRP